MMRSFLKRAGIGFMLGIVICNIISVISANPELVPPEFVERIGDLRVAMLLSMILPGLYGVLTMGFTVLYDSERIPLAAATALHCAICIVPFIPLSLFLGWFATLADVLIMTGIQLAAFFVIWLFIYLRYKKLTRELNEINGRDPEE